MANRNQSPLLTAGGDITTSSFIKLSTVAGHTALQAGANEQIIGISQVGPKEPPGVSGSSALAAQDGDQLQIFGLGDICDLRAGTGGWAAGALLKSDGNGNGVPAAATGTTVQNIGAMAMTAAAAGELAQVQIVMLKTRPALT